MHFFIEPVGVDTFELRLREGDVQLMARLKTEEMRELGYACFQAAETPRASTHAIVTDESKLLEKVIKRLLLQLESERLVDYVWATNDTAVVALIFRSLSSRAANAVHKEIRLRYGESTLTDAPPAVVERARATVDQVNQMIQSIKTEVIIFNELREELL